MIFQKLLQICLSEHEAECDKCTNNEPDVLNCVIDTEQILNVINELSNGKWAGVDGIPYEFDKGISLICCMGKIYTKVLNNSIVVWNKWQNKQTISIQRLQTFVLRQTVPLLLWSWYCCIPSIPRHRLWVRGGLEVSGDKLGQ